MEGKRPCVQLLNCIDASKSGNKKLRRGSGPIKHAPQQALGKKSPRAVCTPGAVGVGRDCCSSCVPKGAMVRTGGWLYLLLVFALLAILLIIGVPLAL